MNERMCDLLLDGMDPPLPFNQQQILRRFANWMDRSNCFLTGHRRSGQTLHVQFSDDWAAYEFSVEQMDAHLNALDKGQPFPWESLRRQAAEGEGQ